MLQITQLSPKGHYLQGHYIPTGAWKPSSEHSSYSTKAKTALFTEASSDPSNPEKSHLQTSWP